MTISILTDNTPGINTDAEHGLSYLVEFDGKRLLFDTGQSDLFLKNAEIMGVDMSNIDVIILSHGHFDHGNGLPYLKGGRLVCHPGCFVKRYRKTDFSYIGLRNSKQEITDKFDLVTSSSAYYITKKIVFLGEIPRSTDFESIHTPFVFENGTPDFVMDDSAIAMNLDGGLFIVTGCGHAGIVNTLEHAKQVTGINKIHGVIGGFHLKSIDRQTKETIEYLKSNRVEHVYPSHCTTEPALSTFTGVFNTHIIKTGEVYNF